jgi:hypothetical protein
MPGIHDVEVGSILHVAENGLLGVITGAVIHNDHFLAHPVVQVCMSDAVEDEVNGFTLIIGRHYNAELSSGIHQLIESGLR